MSEITITRWKLLLGAMLIFLAGIFIGLAIK